MNEFLLSNAKANVVIPDAIVIVGDGLRKLFNEISPSIQSVSNIEKAIELIEIFGSESKNISLIFSGGFTIDSTNEAKAMKQYFKDNYSEIYDWFLKEIRMSRGNFYSNCSIILEENSRNSYGNIKYSLDLAEQNGWQRIVFVDQPLHILQMKLIALKEIRKRKTRIKIDFIKAKPVWGGNIQKQWRNPVIFAIYEFLSTGYYILKGRII